MKAIFLIIGMVLPFGLAGLADPLTQSTFTEIINDVGTVSVAGNTTPASVSEVVQAPERVRTGPQSRAELVAPDQTITRVGADTIFSFADNGRTLNLEQGNVLFHPPKGLGGGTIQSGGAAAAVLGTTIIVSATPSGGFKVILLEGSGTVTLPNGTSATLNAGQLVFVLPGGTLSPVLTINLGRLVGGSLLVNGFPDKLSSLPLIEAAILKQNKLLKSGKAVDTGLPVDAYWYPPGNGLDTIDHGTYQVGVPPPIPPPQETFSSTGAQITGAGPGARGFAPVTSTPLVVR